MSEHFWSKVAIGSEDDCWEWQRFVAPNGYGQYRPLGYGEVYAANGCFVTRYEEGKVVEHWGPYESERKSENARRRIRRGEPNRLARGAFAPMPETQEETMEDVEPQTNEVDDLIMAAWGIIANASEGDWTKESSEWQEAAARWRDDFHAWLRDTPVHA